VHQCQGEPGNQENTAAVHCQSHDIGKGNCSLSCPVIECTAADTLCQLMNGFSKMCRRVQNGENELKDIHRVFQADDDNHKAKAGGEKADDIFHGFHDRRDGLFVL